MGQVNMNQVNMNQMNMNQMSMEDIQQNLIAMNPQQFAMGGGFNPQQMQQNQSVNCKFFAQQGNCKFGDTCNFKHNTSE